MSSTTSAREKERLAALRAYEILDTPAENAYDDFSRLASQICQTSMAVISLVDADRQWFKSRLGVEAHQTPREIAFCDHTIRDDRVMVVPDAARDARFAGSPLVTSDPHIRFYAGAPLLTPAGHRIGAVCAIDRVPHELSTEQVGCLTMLSRQVMNLLESRRVSGQLAQALRRIKLMEDLIPICSYCKSIRNDEGFWATLEVYMEEHAAADFTHGICPTCMDKHFGHILEAEAAGDPAGSAVSSAFTCDS